MRHGRHRICVPVLALGVLALVALAGLPALALAWGAIDDVGYLTLHKEIKQAITSRLGRTLTSTEALNAMERELCGGLAVAAVFDPDWKSLRRVMPIIASPRVANLARYRGKDDETESVNLRQRLLELQQIENDTQQSPEQLENLFRLKHRRDEKIMEEMQAKLDQIRAQKQAQIEDQVRIKIELEGLTHQQTRIKNEKWKSKIFVDALLDLKHVKSLPQLLAKKIGSKNVFVEFADEELEAALLPCPGVPHENDGDDTDRRPKQKGVRKSGRQFFQVGNHPKVTAVERNVMRN